MKRMWVDAALGGTRDQKTRLYGWEVLIPEYPGLTFVAAKTPDLRYQVFEMTSGESFTRGHRLLREAVTAAYEASKKHTYAELQEAVRDKIVARATHVLGE